jgi:hypothetical protein
MLTERSREEKEGGDKEKKKLQRGESMQGLVWSAARIMTPRLMEKASLSARLREGVFITFFSRLTA